MGGVRRDRHRGGSHRPGEARRRHLRLAADPERRRPLRPHQHRDRPGVRHRGRVPRDVRYRQLVRRHDHRRHRPRPHRQGRRLPARRDEVRRLPRHLPHGRDRPARTGTCCPTSPPARTRSTSTPATEEWLDKAGYIIGRLQRVIFYAEGVKETNWSATGAGRRRRRRRAPLGLPALLQGRAAVDQLARPVVRRHAARDRRRPALAGRPRHRRPSPGRQRLPGRREDRAEDSAAGPRATRCRRPRTT